MREHLDFKVFKLFKKVISKLLLLLFIYDREQNNNNNKNYYYYHYISRSLHWTFSICKLMQTTSNAQADITCWKGLAHKLQTAKQSIPIFFFKLKPFTTRSHFFSMSVDCVRTQFRENTHEELTSVSQDAIDAVFRTWFVFLNCPFHHFFIVFLILTRSAEFGAHDAADGAHWVRWKSSVVEWQKKKSSCHRKTTQLQLLIQ